MTAPLMFEVQDQWGRTIRLTEDVWIGHIVAGHSVLQGQLDAVRETLIHSDIVRFDDVRSDAECFYRLGIIAAIPHRHVKVVVRFFADDDNIGYVNTAYISRNIPAKEPLRWQK